MKIRQARNLMINLQGLAMVQGLGDDPNVADMIAYNFRYMSRSFRGYRIDHDSAWNVIAIL